jgi:polyisoprenoid-binding protein YceI
MTRRLVASICSVVAAASLLSCTSLRIAAPAGEARLAQGAPTDLRAEYAAMAQAKGKVFTLDPDKSVVRIYVFRGGVAARAGHNHVVSAPQFVGFYYLPASGASDGRFDLEFRLDQLKIDDPASETALGGAFMSRLSTEDIAGARRHMLGPDNLQADKYPLVRVHSIRIVGEAPKFAADIQVTMHGQVRELWVPLTVTGLPDHLTVAGSFVLRQSDFGVKPYSVLHGLLAVQDELVIEFNLSGA